MYCAFAATPFPQNDWFILRVVKEKPDDFSIGFCPDYGVQEAGPAKVGSAAARRIMIRQALNEIEDNFQPVPESANRPHAFKGFEWKFRPDSPQELANTFIETVLEWEKLFRRII